MTSPRHVPIRPLVLTLLLAGSVLWGYWPVFHEMAAKWFNNPQYSHAYLVPLFSAYLLWRSRGGFLAAQKGPDWWGVALLLAAALLRLAGAFLYVSWLEAISLLPLLWGAALALGGRPALRWSWVATGFLAFMIPLPYSLETSLSQPLQKVATYAGTYALQTMGWPAFSEGNVILVNDSQIGVVEACNGLGMLLLFFAVAAGVALLIDRPWPDRLAVVLSAAPIAVLANVVRIVLTSVLYETAGQRWGDLVFHDLAGWLMMPLALGMLWLELRLISYLTVEVPQEGLLSPVDFAARQEGAGLLHAQVG